MNFGDWIVGEPAEIPPADAEMGVEVAEISLSTISDSV